MVLSERCFFDGILVRVELHGDLRYRLSYGGRVAYENGERRVEGRRLPYRFRSVEQLRYDFEQDVRALGGRFG